MKKLFTITELSNITLKTRPTLYRYIANYDNGDYRDIPYLFVELFKLIDGDNTKKQDVIRYCEENFIDQDGTEGYKEFMQFIKVNKEKIDFKKLLDDITNEYKGEISWQPQKKNY